MSSLSDKLKSLGVKVGVSEINKPNRPDRSIDKVLNGSFQETPFGRILITDTLYASNYQQGKTSLSLSSSLLLLSEWIDDARLSRLPSQALGFLDTETTGLSGGTGTYAFLVGAGKFEGDQFHLIQIFMADPSEEPALLYTLEDFFKNCQATITFNGKAFDLPLLRSRFAMNGLTDPFHDYVHVDLLHMARRIWRDCLPSKSLGNLEAQILSSERTEDDVPGWLIPQLYFDFIRDGDAAPLKKVLYHNAMDVVSMAALLNHITWLLTTIPDAPTNSAEEQLAVARLYSELKHHDTAIHIYQRLLSYGIQNYPSISIEMRLEILNRLARIYKEIGKIKLAEPLWEEAASLNDPYACIELAKYNEHILKQIPDALRWTRSALLMVDLAGLDQSEKISLRLELDHREKRLKRKTGAYSPEES